MSSSSSCYPDDFQTWLFDAIDLRPGDETEAAILEPLFQLNHAWVSGKPIPDYADRKSLMRAYTCFYTSINMPKLWRVLDHSGPLLSRLLTSDTIRVTELGCGPGTFLFAFLFYLKARAPAALSRPIVCRGIDRSPQALELAEALAAGLKQRPAFRNCRFEFQAGDWQDDCDRPDDLLIFGNVLNEGQTLPSAIAAHSIIVIEPGTQPVFHRAVLPFRNRLFDDNWQILFPCTSAHPCPMAADNWCHFHVNRFQLPFIQRICSQAKRLNARHHYCALSFIRTPAELPSSRWRVLSRLRRRHRSGIRWLCDGKHMVEAVLNRKAKEPHNRWFLKAKAGDAVQIEFSQPVRAFLEKGRLQASDRIQPVAPTKGS